MMLPIGAQADVTVYGKIHNTINFHDPADGSDSTVDVGDSGSRIGFRASSDLGNGMTGHGHFEFNANSAKNGTGITRTRLGYVGLSGGFGTINIGQQSTAFSKLGGIMDPTFYVGPVGGAGDFRSANTIQYSNAVGPLSLAVDVRLNDTAAEDAENWSGDGTGLGLQVAATENLTLTAAFNTEEKTTGLEETIIGAAANVSFGNLWGSIGWTNQENLDASGATTSDTDYLAAYFGADFTDSTRGMVGFSQSDDDTNEPSKIMAGVYHELGGGLSLLYEGAAHDMDAANMDDDVQHIIGLQINF